MFLLTILENAPEEIEIWDALQQVPALSVFAFLTIKAIQYIRDRDESQRKHEQLRDEALRETISKIASETNAAHERATDAARENTRVLGSVAEILRDVSLKLEKVKDGGPDGMV